MEEAIFKVEIITPTIMGGANSGKLDSIFIRPTEIKSTMRQAFRLVAGKYVEHNKKGIEKLYELESEVFGNTQGKGKFRLIVDVPTNLRTEKIKLLPHKSDFSKFAILPNKTFNLKIISYKYPVEFYKALLNIAFLLGVGHRRNRLFGNMQIEQFEWKDEIQKIDRFFIAKRLKEIKTNNPSFACFSKREDDKENFIIDDMLLKDEFIPIKKQNNFDRKNFENFEFDKQNFEKALENLYGKVIHGIKEKKLDFILGGARPRQASFVNFSILKFNQNYRLFVMGFYYKNEKFKYNDWKNAIEEVKKLTKETFEKRGLKDG
ncbi:type III-B CRISPR module RAMP protein Cmr1 [Sulfurihydrogenibium yellowstonense]|uniref:Crispr-associated ramp protein n=1 Tax=Sulfurihydrogenibium yellowstonense SS-5 TaxID=432331 RepID=C4FJQ8_9AQUI|nr:type III-B CRISPR module RAMP protein Cmr1 [Sulfurihydrogenibium yellowstonense]EEP60696.1 crispr-associated ramp protein [Sulfurihydrogenibium yellowstonense SS-5]